MQAYFPAHDAIARHTAGGHAKHVLAAVASRYIGAHPPEPLMYRVHSRQGFRRLEDCRYDMDLMQCWPQLSAGQFVYVWAMLWAEQDGETPFAVSCYSPVKIYINGSLAFQSNLNDDVFPNRRAFFRAKTRKGRNDIVLEFVAVGTGCGGIFGTGSVKGAPMHFLNPTGAGRGCEGWVYSGPQQARWRTLPGWRGCQAGESKLSSHALGSGDDSEQGLHKLKLNHTDPFAPLLLDRDGVPAPDRLNECGEYTAWYPQEEWTPVELRSGCFHRLFGVKPGAKAFAWCKLELRGALRADLRLEGRYAGKIAVYVGGKLMFQGGEESGRIDISLQDIRFGTQDLVVESTCGGEDWGFEFNEPQITCASSPQAVLRLVRPYPIEGMRDHWLYLGAFSADNAPSAAEVPVIDRLFGQGQEATYWRVDRPECWVRPYLETPLYGRWNYPLGVTLYGLLRTGVALSAPHYTEYAAGHIEQCSKWHDYTEWDRKQYGAPGLNHQLSLIDSLDDCGSFGAAMLTANKLRPILGVERAAAHIAHYITNVQDRLPDGAFYRTRGTVDFMKDTMWCDDLYMSTPFLAKYYELTGDERYLDDAASQFLRYKERLFIPELGIMHHVFDDKFGKPNGVPWGRGNGWVIFSLTELLTIMPPEHKLRPELLEFYRELSEGYRKLQSANGMWHQVLTDGESYAEASCTAMFIYAFAHGVRHGWLEEPDLYLEAAVRGWEGLTETCIDKHGNVYGVCRGSGYSFNKLYYKEELDWQLNDTHGIGIVLLAGIEIVQLESELVE
ncbi:glycoside hydrolase family 88/105 protein [Paenibacillus humicus]|uniref:glycoside hydrolase family 88/105 protein n=1 Tax=Paenibacillus humicus TaxID=412861 RepID=UPI003D287550